MIAANLLLVEDRRTSTPSFAPLLEKKGYAVRVEHTARQALRTFAVFVPDVVIIDAASLRTSGVRMCRSVHAALDGTPILLLAPENSPPDPYPGANLVLVQPFTGRKVLNGVARLLPFDHSGSCLRAGPLKLNVAQRRVSCGERENRLTPKQARLLEVFMRNPGQLLSRKFLIKYVWDTAFLGDTRTLDVHMSWLRRVIEPDPSHPRYLKTIRGSGYRLDLPEE
ncbi:MAG: response regulator transcription factor [Chloroflexi bacterium]|nr:response regulator transcription factor [Chloroflexota bacterium]